MLGLRWGKFLSTCYYDYTAVSSVLAAALKHESVTSTPSAASHAGIAT